MLLPAELLVYILQFLSPTDIRQCAATCSRLRAVCLSNAVWRHRFSHEFPLLSISHLSRVGDDYCYHAFNIASRATSSRDREVNRVTQALRDVTNVTRTVAARLQDSQCEAAATREALASLQQPPSYPVTPLQQQIFQSVARQYLHRNPTGIITLSNTHGRPLVLSHVRQADTGSVAASPRTLRSRSQWLEYVTGQVSSPAASSSADTNSDMVAQQSSIIRRNTDQFIAASSAAGLKIAAKFSVQQAAAVKGMMSWTMWTALKRALHQVFGYDVLGTTTAVRQEIDERCFEYEYGTFKVTDTGKEKTVHFVRVSSVREVIVRTLTSLHKTGGLATHSNFPADQLRLLVAGDKGGSSTKLVLVFLNASQQHSVKTARLIAMFQGAKDTRAAVEAAFQPLLKEVFAVVNTVADLQIPCPPQLVSKDDQPQPTRQKPRRRPAARRRRRMKKGKRGHKKFPTMVTAPLAATNTTTSASCRICRRLSASPPSHLHTQNVEEHENTPLSQQVEDMEVDKTFSTAKVVLGGDWEFIANVAGLSGANGVHFCNHCKVRLTDMPKGEPHAPVIFRRYQPAGVAKSFEDRTVEGMKADNRAFRAAEVRRNQVPLYNNCQFEPLLPDGKMVELASCMPLHISLGLGLQALTLADAAAGALDEEVKQARGHSGGALADAFHRQEDLLKTQDLALATLHDELEPALAVLQNNLQELHDQHSQDFMQVNGRLPQSAKAKASRRQAVNLKKEAKEIKECMKTTEETLKETAALLDAVDKVILEERGPFKEALDTVLDNMNLKRRAYHKGALVGADVDKILQKQNYTRIAAVFKPRAIETVSRQPRTFGSDNLQRKVFTLLHKLSQCYELYAPSRALCAHEIELLALRCYSFGNWMPVNFPEASLKRKLHVLTHHVPQKARDNGSVGMEAEHVAESIHPVCNRFERAAATIQNMEEKLLYIAKATWIPSDTELPDYRQPEKRS